MEPIADVTALRPILAALEMKKLVVSLSPEGRGHVLTHALYSPREMEHLRAQFAAGAFTSTAEPDDGSRGRVSPRLRTPSAIGKPTARQPASARPDHVDRPLQLAGESNDALLGELREMRAQVAQLRGDLDELAATLRQTDDDVRRLKSELGI